MPEGELVDAAWTAWSTQIRYVGVGAMIVGGLSSMWGIRSGIGKGVKQTLGGLHGKRKMLDRTDRDLPTSRTVPILVGAAVATVVPLLGLDRRRVGGGCFRHCHGHRVVLLCRRIELHRRRWSAAPTTRSPA